MDVCVKIQASMSDLVKFHLMVLTLLGEILLENELCPPVTWPWSDPVAYFGIFCHISMASYHSDILLPALDLAGPRGLDVHPCPNPPDHPTCQACSPCSCKCSSAHGVVIPNSLYVSPCVGSRKVQRARAHALCLMIHELLHG